MPTHSESLRKFIIFNAHGTPARRKRSGNAATLLQLKYHLKLRFRATIYGKSRSRSLPARAPLPRRSLRMLNWISRFWRTSVIGSFLAGLLFLMPIVLTVFIAAYIVNFVRGAIGPGTVLGDLLTWGGTYILGPSQDTLAFWLGVA